MGPRNNRDPFDCGRNPERILMGVYRSNYLMIGIDVGAKAFDWDKHQAEIEGAPDRLFDIVYDSMCGNYCIAGKIIASNGGDEDTEMVKVDPEKMNLDRVALAAIVSESFGRNVSADDFSLILFSHFS